MTHAERARALSLGALCGCILVWIASAGALLIERVQAHTARHCVALSNYTDEAARECYASRGLPVPADPFATLRSNEP